MDYAKICEALRGRYMAFDVTGNHKYAQLFADAAAAIEALQKDLTTLQKCYEIADTTVDEVLKQLPKRGEIVRCVDCKWNMSCGYISTRSFKEWKDWFCADGERKEAEHE